MAAVTESPTKSALPEEAREAMSLLAQGKRHLLVRDYQEAVGSLAKACELLDAHYGCKANECGDAYLHYGRALLELSRSETGILGDALGEEGAEDSTPDEDEEEDDDDDDEDEDGEGEDDKAVENGEGESESEKKEEVEKPSEETTKTGEDGEAKPTETASSSEGENVEKEDKKDAEEGGEAEDDDASNLKLAWEMLELAKIVFERQPQSKQSALKLADVYLLLGEVGLESEMYEQAVSDMKNCLKLQKEHLEEDDRRIAETFYQLGMAFALSNSFDESLAKYTSSADLIELRIKNLEIKVKSGDKPEENDAFYTVEGEIKELKDLLPEIREKINEMKETKLETIKAVSRAIRGDGEGSGAGSSKDDAVVPAKPEESDAVAVAAATAKPVSNISHLVRKKRKAEDGVASETPAAEVAAVQENGKGTEKADAALPAKIAKTE